MSRLVRVYELHPLPASAVGPNKASQAQVQGHLSLTSCVPTANLQQLQGASKTKLLEK